MTEQHTYDGIQCSDMVEDACTLDGLSGRFIMSIENGTTFEVPFYFDGKTRQLALHGIAGHELVPFRTFFYDEAKELWMATRDGIRDSDKQTVEPWRYVPGLVKGQN
jgi:hypothetical protein